MKEAFGIYSKSTNHAALVIGDPEGAAALRIRYFCGMPLSILSRFLVDPPRYVGVPTLVFTYQKAFGNLKLDGSAYLWVFATIVKGVPSTLRNGQRIALYIMVNASLTAYPHLVASLSPEYAITLVLNSENVM